MSVVVPRIEVRTTQPEHCDALAALEAVVFPTLAPEEWFTGEMYRAQVATFPDGQLVALAHTPDGEQIVGCTTSFRTSETFEDDYPPYYFDFIGRGYLTTHEPEGEWLYGIGLMVHPDFRRLGIGSRIYKARQAVVQRLNLRGELVAGLMPGYERYRDSLTVDDYAAKVVAGELTDPTLTMQLRNGFTVRRLLHGFIHDPRSGDTASLLVRENPHWRG
jgi:GNAT superfamily N-acetyltransferase